MGGKGSGAGSGGARPGAGKPPKTLSAKRIDDLLKIGRACKRQYGKSPEELLMEIAYAVGVGTDATLAQQFKALEAYLRHTMPTSSEQQVNVTKVQEPAIYLPEQKPDPVGAEAMREAAEQHVKH